jgi:hypothetical protein
VDRSGGVYGGAELALLEQTGTYTRTYLRALYLRDVRKLCMCLFSV